MVCTTHRSLRGLATSLLVLSTLALPVAVQAQTVQYRSPTGAVYRSRIDTGPIARARTALDADPRTAQRYIALAVAQSGAWQFREAIETLTRGLTLAPDNAMLHRWRGHRYISVREFAKARADLTRGFALDSTNYGILYHFGVLNFVEGDFNAAAAMFMRSQARAPDGGELAGSTDWLWMSLSRAGRGAEAATMLARRPDSLPTAPGYAYVTRLKLYRGELTPETMIAASDTAAVQVATLNYGLGNWYTVHGDRVKARAAFERSVASGGWAGFGFIVSEVELRGRRSARARRRA
jgi:tetratricopeptide (TPR) repeat protein